MSERPILFSGAMVKAILEGRKTMTRRVVKFPGVKETWRQAVEHQAMQACYPMPKGGFVFWSYPVGKDDSDRAYGGDAQGIMCPYGAPGDRLWVRETWRCEELESGLDGVRYRADGFFRPIENTIEASEQWIAGRGLKKDDAWRPSIFMPRWASRITLKITYVDIQRLQVLSSTDACSEGIIASDPGSPIRQYAELWDRINGKNHPWASNPWVWVIGFEKVGP